jgi:hypothetical protein
VLYVRRSAGAQPEVELRHVFVQHSGTGAVIHELPVTPRFNQPGTCQFFQVMRNGGLPYRKAITQSLAADFGLPGDVLQNLETARIRKRFRDPLELLGIQGQCCR